MELTSVIIFFGALVSMILWIIKLLLTLSSPKYIFEMSMGAKITINVAMPIILFFIMAISAGIAWG